jgi:hypothetical protein
MTIIRDCDKKRIAELSEKDLIIEKERDMYVEEKKKVDTL